MKKILYLLPLFLGILACGVQPLPTQDVGNIVNATLTAIAQNNLQGVAPQLTFTPVPIQKEQAAIQATSSELHYYWPTTLPEGFALTRLILARLIMVLPSNSLIRLWDLSIYQAAIMCNLCIAQRQMQYHKSLEGLTVVSLNLQVEVSASSGLREEFRILLED